MRRFLRSKKFIVMVCVVALLTALTVTFGILSDWASPQSVFVGSIVTPIQNAFSDAADAVTGFFGVFGQRDELAKENAELKEQLNALTEEKLEWQEALNENEFYEDFLGLKEENEDFTFCAARVIARDPADVYGTMTIDAGSIDGISAHDVVITADGLVGYVSTVAPTYCTVVTILDPSVNVGAYDRRTDDSGIISGSVDTVADRKCRISNLNRYSTVVEGDYIVTGGSGLFPADIIIGTVTEVAQDEGQLTLHATVEPAADIFNCRNVMVITSFSGQGELPSAQSEGSEGN